MINKLFGAMGGKGSLPPIKSLIALGNEIEGHIRFTDGLRVDGVVKGDIRATAGGHSILVISETAVVSGHVEAAQVIVNGVVKGPIYATDLLELQPKARVEGDVHYQALEMHQGATISGQLKPLGKGQPPVLKLSNPSK